MNVPPVSMPPTPAVVRPFVPAPPVAGGALDVVEVTGATGAVPTGGAAREVAAEPAPEVHEQIPHPADKFYSDQPLGAMYSPRGTTLRVFAPTASVVQVRLYEGPVGGTPRVHTMAKSADGTWDLWLPGNQLGKYYTYTANGPDAGFDPTRELVDPYARCVTGFEGRSMITADETPVAPRPTFPVQDAVIYEMSIRDFTMDPDSGVQRRGKYTGLTEGGTHLFGRPDVVTGLDHVVELGANTVQIMPFTEFASDEKNDQYGWGYDAILYNSPDGWYASERLDASRVRESKEMIDAFHRRGVRVIMDVVYNHTVEEVGKRAISFEGLCPGYYYRRKTDGSPWNGSACGNEVRSEAPMVRRFIKDSVKQWVNEYKVDGFRFDLMGLIDLQTMKELTEELHAIDPGIIVYGEPWAAGATPIEVTGKGKQRSLGFGVFNDNFRDALKGSVFHPREKGFIQEGSHAAEVRKGVRGSVEDFADHPVESLNYVECHDNHTFWDRLCISTADDPTVTDGDRRAMDKMGAAMIFTSFGVPFIQSGQEFLRTKGGDDNSYNKPDSVNMIRWEQKVENADVYEYYRSLIALRKGHPLFRPATGKDARFSLFFFDTDLKMTKPDKTLGWLIHDASGKDSWKRCAVLVNADKEAREVRVPEGQWEVYGDGLHVSGGAPLQGSQVAVTASGVKVPPRSVVILGEKR